uniref:Ig-like domain-containing protein n=1 Tax=Oryzias latipes TaxID=8090 RepID=A0A3P9JK20_ORYLA
MLDLTRGSFSRAGCGWFLPKQLFFLCLLSLVATAAELIQEDLTLTRRVGESVSFSCGGTQECYDEYRFWYQKKENETFRVILWFRESDGEIYKGYGHPQQDDFTAEKKQSGCELKINKIKVDHSASYYCSCRKRDVHTASRVHVEGSSSLLCLASAMFPPVVQFSWKRQKNNGTLEDLTSEEQLDLRELRDSTSILLLHQQEDSSYKYICSVKHEGGTVEAQTQQGNEGLVTVFNRDSASC